MNIFTFIYRSLKDKVFYFFFSSKKKNLVLLHVFGKSFILSCKKQKITSQIKSLILTKLCVVQFNRSIGNKILFFKKNIFTPKHLIDTIFDALTELNDLNSKFISNNKCKQEKKNKTHSLND